MIHFAGRKYVNESVDDPLRYYDHNVAGTVELCKAMAKHNCKNVSSIFLPISSFKLKSPIIMPRINIKYALKKKLNRMN